MKKIQNYGKRVREGVTTHDVTHYAVLVVIVLCVLCV